MRESQVWRNETLAVMWNPSLPGAVPLSHRERRGTTHPLGKMEPSGYLCATCHLWHLDLVIVLALALTVSTMPLCGCTCVLVPTLQGTDIRKLKGRFIMHHKNIKIRIALDPPVVRNMSLQKESHREGYPTLLGNTARGRGTLNHKCRCCELQTQQRGHYTQRPPSPGGARPDYPTRSADRGSRLIPTSDYGRLRIWEMSKEGRTTKEISRRAVEEILYFIQKRKKKENTNDRIFVCSYL